jgi:hypothetical protein
MKKTIAELTLEELCELGPAAAVAAAAKTYPAKRVDQIPGRDVEQFGVPPKPLAQSLKKAKKQVA